MISKGEFKPQAAAEMAAWRTGPEVGNQARRSLIWPRADGSAAAVRSGNFSPGQAGGGPTAERLKNKETGGARGAAGLRVVRDRLSRGQ